MSSARSPEKISKTLHSYSKWGCSRHHALRAEELVQVRQKHKGPREHHDAERHSDQSECVGGFGGEPERIPPFGDSADQRLPAIGRCHCCPARFSWYRTFVGVGAPTAVLCGFVRRLQRLGVKRHGDGDGAFARTGDLAGNPAGQIRSHIGVEHRGVPHHHPAVPAEVADAGRAGLHRHRSRFSPSAIVT